MTGREPITAVTPSQRLDGHSQIEQSRHISANSPLVDTEAISQLGAGAQLRGLQQLKQLQHSRGRVGHTVHHPSDTGQFSPGITSTVVSAAGHIGPHIYYNEEKAMQLAATRIFTDDVDALVTFYETATGLIAERLHPMFAELRTPSGTLAIASTATVPLLGEQVAEPRANRSVTLDFLVDDVDATYTALQNVVEVFVNEPTDMPWGNRSLLIRDPDGNLINIFTPISEAAQDRFSNEAQD